MKYAPEAIYTAGSLLACIILILAITYNCQKNNERYHQSMESCIAHGGSWVPTSKQNDAACIAGRPAP
jgi:hypothetical protein